MPYLEKKQKGFPDMAPRETRRTFTIHDFKLDNLEGFLKGDYLENFMLEV